MRSGVLIPVVLLGLVAACATNPVTGRRELAFMSEAQEIAIAQESDAQIKGEMGVYNDPELQAYVSDMGQRMARISERPQLPWRFTVVDVPAVNAFAVPGGAIYVTRGILPFLDSEAELAGVIGHEIGHVTARHSAQQYTRQVSGQVGLLALGIFVPQARPFGQLSGQALGVLFMKYGRDDELQADRLGARYEATLGWDPAGAPAFLSTLGRLAEAAGDRRGVPNWMSTHPEPLSRVRDIQLTVDELKSTGGSFATNRDEWLRRVDGVVYGDNPEQGLARGSAFLHPVLRFRIDFPGQWGDCQQSAAGRGSGTRRKCIDAPAWCRAATGTEHPGDRARQHGHGGVSHHRGRGCDDQRPRRLSGVYQGQVEGLGAVTMRAAHIRNDGQIYLVAGIAPPTGSDRLTEPSLPASVRSGDCRRPKPKRFTPIGSICTSCGLAIHGSRSPNAPAA